MIPFQTAIIVAKKTLFVGLTDTVLELEVAVQCGFCDTGKGHREGALPGRQKVSGLHAARVVRLEDIAGC